MGDHISRGPFAHTNKIHHHMHKQPKWNCSSLNNMSYYNIDPIFAVLLFYFFLTHRIIITFWIENSLTWPRMAETESVSNKTIAFRFFWGFEKFFVNFKLDLISQSNEHWPCLYAHWILRMKNKREEEEENENNNKDEEKETLGTLTKWAQILMCTFVDLNTKILITSKQWNFTALKNSFF